MKTNQIVRQVSLFALTFPLLAAFQTRPGEQQPRHAPTVDVCRADVAVWWTDYIIDRYENSENELENSGKYSPNPAGDLPIKEVSARMTEMEECRNVDTRDKQTYSGAWSFYYGVAMERYRRFVDRHGLRDKFMKEDAEGVR